MSIEDSTVLVSLTIRQWNGFTRDKKVTEKVDADFHTAGDSGNFNKRLLAKAVLAPIYKIANRARRDHQFYTVPWCYDSVNMLPSKLFFEYTNVMRGHTELFDNEVDNLVQQYPVHKANRAQQLGAMFNPDDFPSNDELRDMFAIEIRFMPTGSLKHIVIDEQAKDADKIKHALEEGFKNTQREAMKGLYDRVGNLLQYTHDRLINPDNIFRDSLIENLEQLVEVLPGLNVFDDPLLKKLENNIKSQLLVVDAKTLRRDPEVRIKIAQSANDLLGELKAA